MTDSLAGGGYEKWLQDIGVTDAPMVRGGLSTALSFFHLRMSDLPRTMRLNFLKAMDLHSPISEVMLVPDSVVAAFRKSNEDPLRLFYTKAGTSPHQLGVNPTARGFMRFRVRRPTSALQSRSAAALDTWTDASHYYQASGGGLQLVIPEAHAALWVLPQTGGSR
jgi:hypothetical protein